MKKNSLNKALIAVSLAMLIFMAAVVYFGIFIARKYRKTLTDNQNDSMLQTVISTADSLQSLFFEYKADLESFCEAAIDSDDISSFCVSYVKMHSPFVTSLYIENEDTAAVSGKKRSIVSVYSHTRMDGGTILELVRFSDNAIELLLAHTHENGIKATLSISVKSLYEERIKKFHFGEDGYFVIKDSRGIILMHPEEIQWGIHVIKGREKIYPNKDMKSLEDMIQHQLEGKTGIETYSSYWWGQEGSPRSRKISAYTKVDLGNDFLVVSAVVKADDIEGAITESISKLFLLFGVFTVGAITLVSYMMYLTVENRKKEERAAYLTKMNDVLSELHQSEEHIAHQQRLQIIGTMTGGIAHEFNNLLTPIMGYAELLMMSLDENSDEADSAREIYDASEKAKDIIQQLSSMSRKNIETSFKTIRVSDFLKKSIKMVRTVCPENIQLIDDIKITDEKILGNTTQLNQAILNIAVNAIYAIGRKSGHLQIVAERACDDEIQKLKSDDNSQSYIKIDIVDDGTGMSEAVIKQIFEPFFTTKKSGKGTGLGLSVTEQIVTAHRGFISVHSVLGTGSVFHLYFPIQSDEESENVQNGANSVQNEKNISLLVIDDNRKILNQLEKSFKKLPIMIFSAENFAEAKKITQQHKIDVIAAEEQINGESAIDFCMLIQNGKPIKIVMADMLTKELAEAKLYHIIDDCILKPVSDFSIIRAMKDCRREE